MAKDKDEFNFDDDIDSWDDFDDPPPGDGGQNRNPISETARTVRRSALDTVFPRSKRDRIILKGMPKAAEEAYDGYQDVASVASDIYSHTKEELVKTQRSLQLQTKQLLPTMRRYLPKVVTKPIENWAKKADVEYQNDYDPNEAAIQRMLADTFGPAGGQEQSQGGYPDRESRDEAAEEITGERLKETIKDLKQDAQQDTLLQIAKDTRLTTNLQKGVMLNVQRKALELSYRQLFALQDLTKLTQAQFDREAPALDAIVKNTALPDYAKEEFGEITSALMKRKVAEWISPAKYAEGFLEDIRQNATKKITSFFQDTRGIAEMLTGGLDDGDSDLEDKSEISPDKQRQNMIQKGVGLGVGALAKRFIVPRRDKALDYIRGRLEENEAVNNGAHKAQYVFSNLSNISNSAIAGERDGVLADVFRGLNELGIVKPYAREKATIGERSGEYLSQANKFDNRSWITLNEIIPTWLNEINRSIRWGYGEDANLTYDITRRKMVTAKNLANKARKHIAADDARDRLQKRIGDVINLADDGTMDPKTREMFGRYLEDRLSTGREVNLELLQKNPDALFRIAGSNHGTKILDAMNKKAGSYKAGVHEFSNVINGELGAMRGTVSSYQKRLEEFRAIHGDRAIMESGIFTDDETDGIRADRDLTDIYTKFGTLETGKIKSGRSKIIEDEMNRKRRNGSSLNRYFREDGSSVIINEDGTVTEEEGKKDRRRGREKARDRNKANYKDSLTISLQGLSGVLYGPTKTNFVELFTKFDGLLNPGDKDQSLLNAVNHQNTMITEILGHIKTLAETGIPVLSGDEEDALAEDGGSGEGKRSRLSSWRRKRRLAKLRKLRARGRGSRDSGNNEDRNRRFNNAGFFGRWGMMLGETAGKGADLAWRGVTGLKNKAVGGANWLRGLLPASDPTKPGFFKRVLGFGKDGIMSGVHGLGAIGRGWSGTADIYDSKGNVVLEGKKMEDGFYFQRQGKGKKKKKLTPITKLADIKGTGPIYDRNGVLVISQADMEKAGELSYYKGKKWWKLTEIVGSGVGSIANKAFGIPKSLIEFASNPIKKATAWIVNYPDMYVAGEENPRIRGNLMRNGEYRLQGSKKVIRSPSDITGAVEDSTGRVVITDGEVKNPDFKLVDRHGRKVRTPIGRVFSRITGAAGWLSKQVRKIPDKLKGLVGEDGKLRNALTNNPLTRWWNGESKGGKWFSENSFSIGGSSRNTNTILIRIYQLLNKRMAGEAESEDWIKALGGFKGADVKKTATRAFRRARLLARRLNRKANGVKGFSDFKNGAFDKLKQGRDWLRAASPSSVLSSIRDKFQPDRFDQETKDRILKSLEGRTDDVAEYYRARLNEKKKFSPRNINLGLDEKLRTLADNLRSHQGERQIKSQRLTRNVRHIFKGKKETTDELKQRLLERKGAAANMYRDKLAHAVRDMGTADDIRSAPGRFKDRVLGVFKKPAASGDKAADDNNSEKGLLRRIADSMDSMWFDNMRRSAESGGMNEGQTQNLFQRFGRRIKFKENGEQRAFFKFFRRRRRDKDFVGPMPQGGKGKKKRRGKGFGMLGTVLGMALPVLSTLASGVGSLVGWLAKAGIGRLAVGAGSVIGTVAKAAASPLAWVGRGLLAAGTAVVSAVGWPIIAAVAAGAAVLWGGYKLATRKKAEYLDKMRLAQYGYRDYDLWSSDDGAKALYMEGELKPFVTFDRNGSAMLRGLTGKEADRISQGYGIPADDQEATITFHAYAQQRFIPIYLRWLTAIRQTEGTPKLADLGDTKKVSKDTMLAIYNKTKLSKDAWQLKAIRDPREVNGGFWSGVWDAVTFSGPDDLMSAEEVVKVQESVKRDIDWRRADTSWFTTPDVRVNNELIKAAPEKSQLAQTLNAVRAKEVEKAKDLAGNKPWRAFDEVIKTNVDGEHFAGKDDLSALEAIRMKTYGLVTLDYANVNALLRLEDATYKGIDVNTGIWKGDTDKVLDVAFPNIKKDKKRDDIIRWYRYRFLPTFITFCLVLNRYRPGVKPSAHLMNGGYLYELGLATSKSMVQKGDFSSSVWGEDFNPFGGAVNQDPESVKKELELLKRLSKKADMAVRGISEKEVNSSNIDRMRKKWERDSKYSTANTNLRDGWTRDGDKGGGASTLTSSNPLSRERSNGAGFLPPGSTPGNGGWGVEAANVGSSGLSVDSTGTYNPPKDMNAKAGMAAMIKAIKDAGITSPSEIALLLANTKHETGGFKRVDENLRYSPDRLLAIFPKYFRSREDAEAVSKAGPVAIANRVYGGRMGNNEPGDGNKYRGRGYIQVTGKDNYRMISKYAGVDFVNNPDLITSSPEMSAKATIAWWMSNPAVRKLAQNGDVIGLRKKVNGGTIGMADVKKEAGIFLRMAQNGELDRLMSESAADAPQGQQPVENIPATNEARRPEVVEEAAKREGSNLAEAAGSMAVANPAGIKDSGTPPSMEAPISQAAESAGNTYPTMSPDEKKKYEETAKAAAAAKAPVSKPTSDSPMSEQTDTLSVQNQQLSTQKLMLAELQGINSAIASFLAAQGVAKKTGGSSSAPPANRPTVEHGQPTISNGRIGSM